MTRVASKLVLAASILGFASAAFAAGPSLKLVDDVNNIVTIDQNGVVTTGGSCTPATCTTTVSAGSAGNVSWSGRIGNFTLSAFGQSKPALASPAVDISLQNVMAGPVAGTLTASFTDVNFTTTAPYLLNENSTFAAGSSVVTYTGYADTTNTPFGTGTTVGTIGPNSNVFGFLGGLPGPSGTGISLTAKVVVQMAANANFFDDFGFAGTAPVPTPLALACSSSSGTAGTAYNSNLMASGGTGPYTYSIIGSLPNGLVLNPSSGAITGTPSAQGSYSFTAQAVDSSGVPVTNTVTTPCSITISAPPTPLSLTCAANTGQVGSAYNSALVAVGGTGHYLYSISAGSLPTGLFLNSSTGFISGTPTTAGPFSFTGQVTDTGNTTATPVTSNCVITISPAPVGSLGDRVWSDTNGNGVQDAGEPGIVGVTVTLKNSSGTVLATTTTGANGIYTFGNLAAATYTVCVTQPANTTETFDLDGLATPNCATGALAAGQNRTDFDFGYVPTGAAALSIACSSSTATVGVAYASTVVVTGGTGPFTFTVSAGSLPAGLTLNPTTGAITGTPTSAGTSSFTIKVVDSTGASATSSCGIIVSATNICGLSPGYWKNHSSSWPVASLVLGTQTYTKTELLALLNTPKRGDSTIILAFQLIAAKLNVANGTLASTAGTNIAVADQLLSAYGHLPLAHAVKNSQMESVASNLDAFNNDGQLQPGCTNR